MENKCLAVAEMGDRLATIDTGRKSEACAPFGATVSKTVRPMLSARCLSVTCVVLSSFVVLSVTLTGWMNQDETWHAGSPRSWPHCVRRELTSLSPKGAQPPPHFSAHLPWPNGCMEVGLGPGNVVLHWDLAPLPK